MSTLDTIARARQIVTAASQLTWSLYANGDLSVDQHDPIAQALGVADEGIKAVEVLVAERDAALADAAALRNAADQFHYAVAVNRLFDDRFDERTIERSKALMDLVKQPHPGAALLAELAAARAYLGYVLETYPPTSEHEQQLRAAYDRAVKGQSDGNL